MILSAAIERIAGQPLEDVLRERIFEPLGMSTIVGSYRSGATGIEATISAADNRLRLTTGGRFGSTVYELECLADSIWRVRSTSARFFGAIVSFDANGAVFRFSTCRTWALPFRRCT